jgi:hypothetical protein
MTEEKEMSQQDVDVKKIEKEIAQDETTKMEEVKAEVKKEVEATKEEVKQEIKQELTTEQKLAEFEKLLNEAKETNVQLAQKVTEQGEKLEAIPAQRKGLVNQENPMESKPKVEPTDEDIIKLINDNKDGQEIAMFRKSLGL